MSLVEMASAATRRRTDAPQGVAAVRGLVDLAAAAAGNPPPVDAITTALRVITTYIPTEILTLYVAVLAALYDPASKTAPGSWIAFYFFLVLTPISVWAVFANKLKAENKNLPLAPNTWPLWEIIAGTVAYVTWAFALPNSPFATLVWYSAAIAGIVVLVVSTILGLIAPLFQQPLKAS